MAGDLGRVLSPQIEFAEIRVQWKRDAVGGPWVRTAAVFGGPLSRLQAIFLVCEFLREVQHVDFEKFRAVLHDDPHLIALLDAIEQCGEAFSAVQAASVPEIERVMEEKGLSPRIVHVGPGGM